MAENTKIEWAHHTFNPWIGCTKVSQGCANCYAETLMATRYKRVEWGPKGTRKRTSMDNWKKPVSWNKAAARRKERPRVFCASLADWLDNHRSIEIAWLEDLLLLIWRTPHLDWLLLTKRPENFWHRISEVIKLRRAIFGQDSLVTWLSDWLDDMPPDNVWLGTSAEDQQCYDERFAELSRIPANTYFVSAEPLLGPVNLRPVESSWRRFPDWLIVGGESGAGARPMLPDWARSLRDQALTNNIAFHFKQWGGVNKEKAGRKLDGVTWDELPKKLPA